MPRETGDEQRQEGSAGAGQAAAGALHAGGRSVRVYVRQKLARSMEAAAAGRVLSHEQVKKRLSKWLAQ